MRKVFYVAGMLALTGAVQQPALAQVANPNVKMTAAVPVQAQAAPNVVQQPATAKLQFKKDPLPAGAYTLTITTRCPNGTSMGMAPQRVTVTRNGADIQFTVPVVNMAQLNAPGKAPTMTVEGTVDRDGDHNRIYASGVTGAAGTDQPVIFVLNGPTNDYVQSASGSANIRHCDAYTGAYENTTDQASFTLTPVS